MSERNTAPDVEIRRMRLDDLDAVTAIEAATFARPWSRDSFRQELERNVAARYLVAVKDGRVVGYAGHGSFWTRATSRISRWRKASADRGSGGN